MRELEFEPIFTPLDCDRHLDKDKNLYKTCTPMSDPKPTSRLRPQHPVSTPIPPSLQAKMAQFANRANNMNNLESNSRPIGMAARRQRPAFSLRDIDPSILPDPSPLHQGGGPIAAGLGAGRPSLLHLEQTRKPPSQGNFGSPFSNFSKIVYVPSLSSFCFIIFKLSFEEIRLALSISMEKLFYMLLVSTSQMVPLSQSTWTSYSSTKS